MRIRCTCGNWHDLSITALALVVAAFQDGDVQTIGHEGIQPKCLEAAFANDRVARFTTLYPGNAIKFSKMGPRG